MEGESPAPGAVPGPEQGQREQSAGGPALLLQASVLEQDSEQRLQVSHIVAGKTLGPSAPQDVKGEVKDTSTQWNPG